VAKGIMFLSIMDFTDKGIQSVKLTPAYFAKQGWNVHYVVTRDNSKNGSYHYQPVLNPAGVIVHRTAMPSCWVGELLNKHLLRVIYSQLREYAAIIKLAWMGQRVLQNNKIDVIYGGGPHGVLATQIVKLMRPRRKLLTVARFYGVWDLYTEIITGKKWFRFMFNFAVCAALYMRSHLKIITNDGTHGDKALTFIRSSNRESLRFYVNGTDEYAVDPAEVRRLKDILKMGNVFSAVCVTRLVSSKRVDLCIKVTAAVINRYGVSDFKLIVVGDGSERDRFEKLAADLGVAEHIVFVGAVDNRCVKNYLAVSDIFLSTYRISNVGNPLLEAIRANKIIFTLNNGDTSAWIKHRENGFIYDDNEAMVDRMAQDIVELISTPSLGERIKENIRITEREKLWTWNERLRAEFAAINKLVQYQAARD
jgi:glycosyltransferase involved in cell wall biosynthesis